MTPKLKLEREKEKNLKVDSEECITENPRWENFILWDTKCKIFKIDQTCKKDYIDNYIKIQVKQTKH